MLQSDIWSNMGLQNYIGKSWQHKSKIHHHLVYKVFFFGHNLYLLSGNHMIIIITCECLWGIQLLQII